MDLYYHPYLIETFDISIKKSPYQLGIRLTEEVKNKILGKSPVFKKSSGGGARLVWGDRPSID